ncbi:hypothetical protein [Soonwooa purpurea]
MKNILTALMLSLGLGLAIAQSTQPVTTKAAPVTVKKTEVKKVTKTSSDKAVVTDTKTKTVKLKKDGTPDKRYKQNQHLKKDGTPDKRYKENK